MTPSQNPAFIVKSRLQLRRLRAIEVKNANANSTLSEYDYR